MIIKWIWSKFLYEVAFYVAYVTPSRIALCILLSIIALPFDILLLPLEILALIIYKIIPDKGD